MITTKELQPEQIKEYYNFDPINKVIERFFNNQNENNNLCIYGAWGSGKTTLIKYWEVLSATKYKIIKINIWEHNLSENGFVSIIFSIFKNLEKEKIIDKNLVKKIFNFAKSIKLNPYIKFMKTFDDGTVLEGGINVKKNKEPVKEFLKFEDSITNIIKDIDKSLSASKEKIIVIFDDLDRMSHDHMIHYLNIINNFLLRINRMFFLVVSDLEYIDSVLVDRKKERQNYSKKIFNLSLDVDWMIKKPLESIILKKYQNFEKINSAINKEMQIDFRTLEIAKIKTEKLLQDYYEDFIEKKHEDFVTIIYLLFLIKEKDLIFFKKIINKFNSGSIDEKVAEFFKDFYNIEMNQWNKEYFSNLSDPWNEYVQSVSKSNNNIYLENNQKASFNYFFVFPFFASFPATKFIKEKKQSIEKTLVNHNVLKLIDIKEFLHPIAYIVLNSIDYWVLKSNELKEIIFLTTLY